MMRCIRLAALACLALLLAACAATGPRFTEVQASLPTLQPGEGRIYVLRDSSAVGGAVRPEIRLNGQGVGTALPGGFFFVDRPAGHYTASARTESESAVDFDLQAEQTVYVSLRIVMGLMVGRPQLALQPAEMGAAAVQGLAYTGSVPLVPLRAASTVAASPPGRAPTAPAAPAAPAAGPARGPGAVTLDDLRGLLPPAQR